MNGHRKGCPETGVLDGGSTVLEDPNNKAQAASLFSSPRETEYFKCIIGRLRANSHGANYGTLYKTWLIHVDGGKLVVVVCIDIVNRYPFNSIYYLPFRYLASGFRGVICPQAASG